MRGLSRLLACLRALIARNRTFCSGSARDIPTCRRICGGLILPIQRTDGKRIPATDVIEHHLGRSWQRWSRHLAAGQWRSGVDGLENFLALVRRELERSVQGPVQ